MSEEIKTEDIIKSLRMCANSQGCTGCIMCDQKWCENAIRRIAADRLEQLNTFDRTQSAKMIRKVNALETENELLRGALASTGKGGYYLPVIKTCKNQMPSDDAAALKARIMANQSTDHFADANKMVPDDDRLDGCNGAWREYK